MENRKILKSDGADNYLRALNPNHGVTLISSSLSEQSHREGGLEVGRIFELIRRRATLVAGVTIAVLCLTFFWSRSRPPKYEGNFKMLIEPVKAESQVVSAVTGSQPKDENQDFGSIQSSKENLDYPTQIQLLLSPKLLLSIVQKLESLYPQISYDSLRGSLNITRLKDPAETKILDVRYKSGSLQETTQVINLVSQTYIRYSLKERQTNLRRAIQFLDAQRPKVESQVRTLELALQTFREKNQLIDPSILGAQISSQVGNTQQQQLEAQVELVRTRQLYRSLEQQLQLQPKGAEAASVLSEAPEYQLLVKQLQELDVELQTQSAELAQDHPKILSLKEKRAKLLPLLQQKANAVLGSKLSESIPDAKSLPYQNSLRQDLSKQFVATAIQVQVLEAKLRGLASARQVLARQSEQFPVISRQYENLQRQLKIATEQLSKFLQKREDLMIIAARQDVPWELIASPTVNEIPSASLIQNLSLGLVLGLLLGSGIALLLERMNNVIHSLGDLRGEVEIPILGMIPRNEDEKESIFKSSILTNYDESDFLTQEKGNFAQKTHYQFSPFLESFRALNSQIRLLRPDSPIQSLVVSSSLPDEGKSTISIHLAQAAAAMGQKVLYVDADFRKPSLQNLVNQQNEQGLSNGLANVIVGSIQLMDAVQAVAGNENLFILPKGSIASDPTSLLSSKRMVDLMMECQIHFDLIIYDSVPLIFADSLLLIPKTDGLLMVTRLGRINREILQRSLRTLEVSNVPVLGLVVNMVDQDKSLAGPYKLSQ
jgi:polysaccharide biosynthesis transport protein